VSSGAALWQSRFACLVRFSVTSNICMRRTLLNLRQADSLAFSVRGDTLGIILELSRSSVDRMVVFFDILVWFPCWLVQQ